MLILNDYLLVQSFPGFRGLKVEKKVDKLLSFLSVKAWGQIIQYSKVPRCKLLHLEWMGNEVLLYSAGNYIQSIGREYNGG